MFKKMFDIEDLFIQIINSYISSEISDIPKIIHLNKISKIHYKWMKKTAWYKHVEGIIISYKWLKVQKIRKTLNFCHDLKLIIGSWSEYPITNDNIDNAVILYNALNSNQLKGCYPYYNICYKFIYPDDTAINNNCYKDYKYYPYINTIYNIDCNLMIQTVNDYRKIRKKDLELRI